MIKYRIGILGTENSHAEGFAKLINMPDENGNFLYPDCRITMVYSRYPDVNEHLVKEYGVEKIAQTPEEMLGNVDAIMVTARDGKFHLEFAKPFLEAGIPAFIDKPFTVDPKEAIELISIAKKNNAPICGGSSLKFSEEIQELKEVVKANEGNIFGGTVAAPLQIQSEYSGFFFYAPHLTEMTLEIFGNNPRSVTAVRNNRGVCAIIDYDDFSVTNNYTNGSFSYSGAVYLENEPILRKLDLAKSNNRECDEFVEMLRTGKMARPYEEYPIPVFYMNAVKKSYETGKKVEIEYL